MHVTMQPKIFYFGTPVVLLSTLNPDGTTNIAPMSSAWWLGKTCMLGMGTRSQTVANLQPHAECVLNLPSADMVSAIDKLALTTGKQEMPEYKIAMGFRYEPDKFACAQLTPQASEVVQPSRILECPVQLEAKVSNIYLIGAEKLSAAIEVQILHSHIEESLLNAERRHHIDPDKWKPLIMSFCEFYSLGANIHDSRLAKVF